MTSLRNSRHFAMPPPSGTGFPAFEEWLQKFYTDDVSLPRSDGFFWLVVPRGKFPSTNQKHYPDLGIDTSSVWNFFAGFSDSKTLTTFVKVSFNFPQVTSAANCVCFRFLDVKKPSTHMLILPFNFTIIRLAQVFIVVLLNILIVFWLHLVILQES